MDGFPGVVTHNYHPGRGALRNLCTLPRSEASAILEGINASRPVPLEANYLERRLRTERWLYAERVRKLGESPLEHPVYFFLGDFADGLDPSRPESLVVPLSALPPDVLTFTFPDSMASLALATKAAHVEDRKPYHGQVFTLDEIIGVVAAFGMPDHSGKTAIPETYDRFIEVQVWDDRPLRCFLAG